jgi:signal transduction histidine kinase
MLIGSMNPSDEQKKRMQYISNGISQLSRLIEDLVDWASIESGKFRLEMEAQDPGKVVEDCVGAQLVRAQQRGITLKAEVGKGLPRIQADKRRLTQVLGNLLENALRHTAKGGSVAVSAVKHEGAVRIGVTDTGEGIDPSEIQKIFESFYQPQSSHAARGRLGLGLSISKEIVHSHGGKIWVESEGKGKGASFLFTIPADKGGKKA